MNNNKGIRMLAFNVVPINDIHQSALILGQKKKRYWINPRPKNELFQHLRCQNIKQPKMSCSVVPINSYTSSAKILWTPKKNWGVKLTLGLKMNYFDTWGQIRQQLSISFNCDNNFFIIVKTYSIGMVDFNGHVLKSINFKL